MVPVPSAPWVYRFVRATAACIAQILFLLGIPALLPSVWNFLCTVYTQHLPFTESFQLVPWRFNLNCHSLCSIKTL